MVEFTLPRYTRPRPNVKNEIVYWWECPTAYREKGFPHTSVKLGTNLSQRELDDAAKICNDRLDEWNNELDGLLPSKKTPDYGTVEWLFHEYQRHRSFTANVSEQNRPDYRRLFAQICTLPSKKNKNVRLGDAMVSQITPKTAQGVYDKLFDQGNERQAEKAVMYSGTAWKRMAPHYKSIIENNPWEGVTQERRQKKTKPHATRDQVYEFAFKAIRSKRYADNVSAVAAVICFEWLMRPNNIRDGHLNWNDIKSNTVRIAHHKNKSEIDLDLFTTDDQGEEFALYPELMTILSMHSKRGHSVICNELGLLYKGSRLGQLMKRACIAAGVEPFTLDACRHGGMTELEEAELTPGQGRSISGHKTDSAYRGYAKLSRKRSTPAAIKRRLHVEKFSEKPKKLNENKGQKS